MLLLLHLKTLKIRDLICYMCLFVEKEHDLKQLQLKKLNSKEDILIVSFAEAVAS